MKKEDEDSSFWEEGYFAETLSSNKIKGKKKTLNMKHDENMNFNCRKCGKKISGHNKDWHNGMCDDCFNKTYFK